MVNIAGFAPTPTTRAGLSLRTGTAATLASLIIASCVKVSPPPSMENPIPLNLDFSIPSLVDGSTWGWAFHELSNAGVTVEVRAQAGELRLDRDPQWMELKKAGAVYDLNSSFAGQQLQFSATVQRPLSSSASARIGVLVLSEDWEVTEFYSGWSSAGRIEAIARVPHNSWNAQLVAEYRGHGEMTLNRLRLTVDGTDAGPALPGQEPTSPQLVRWIREHSVELATTDPTAPLDDLEQLVELVGDKPLILLGESTHGTSEFFDLKARIFRWLALQGGHLVLAIEDHPDKVERIDHFVQTGEGDASDAIKGLFSFWARREFVEFVRWMREATARGDVQISVTGIDSQVPLGPIERLQAGSTGLDPDALSQVGDLLTPMRMAWESGWYPLRETAEYLAWATAAKKVRAILETAGASERTLFDADLVWQSAQISATQDIRVRDRYMAENLAWLREQLPARARIVAWAHNTHVRLDENAMGQRLEEQFPNEVLSVGLFTNSGEYVAFDGSSLRTYALFAGPTGSLEQALHLAKRRLFALDLRPREGSIRFRPLEAPMLHRNIGLWPADFGFYRAVIPDGFHALVYVDATTPTRPLER